MEQYRTNGWIDYNNKDYELFKRTPCKGCLEATRNLTHYDHKRQTDRTRNAKRREEIGHFHCDILFLSGKDKYVSALLMVDEKTRYAHIRFQETKEFTSEAAIEAYAELLTCVKNYGHTIKSIRWDGEMAIWSAPFGKWLTEHNIKRDRNTSSEQNLAEMRIRRVRDKAQRALWDKNLPLDPFEHHAYRNALMLTNLQTAEPLMGRTPFQEYEHKNPARALMRTRPFGIIAYYLPPNKTKHDKAQPYVYVGLDRLSSANYFLYNPKTDRITTTNAAKFLDTILHKDWWHNLQDGQDLNYSAGEYHELEDEDENLNFDNQEDEILLTPVTSDNEDSTNENSDTSEDEANEPEPIPIRRSTRTRKAPQRYIEINYIAKTNKIEIIKETKRHPTLLKETYPSKIYIHIPKNRREMLKSPYKEEFIQAEKIEIDTIQRHETIKFVKQDQTKHKLKTRMVYDVKANEKGEVLKFKARLVALGYDMRRNEYEETYAPVARWTTLLILIILGWYNKMEIRLLDFKGAYLHTKRPENIPVYLADIPGITTPPDRMIFLNKGLYGTLDAGNLWRETVEKLLKRKGYTQAKNDPCLFYKKRRTKGNTYTTYIATWVDDLLIVSDDPETENIRKDFEKDKFEISHFDKINQYLGVRVKYDKKTDELTLDQVEYIKEIIEKANMKDSNPKDTPMTKPVPSRQDTPMGKLEKLNEEKDTISQSEYEKRAKEIRQEEAEMKNVPYRSILGMLSHLTRMTRPDIQFATFYHARYQNKPGRTHWKTIKRIVRYIKRTINLILKANRNLPQLQIFTDSDHGGDPDNGKSTTGIIILMYGIPILAKSGIQRINAKSSTNAEIIALCDTVEEVVWIKNLLTELEAIKEKPTILVDNQPAIDTVKHNKICKGNKHIANRYYFVKDNYKQKQIDIKHIATNENIADIMTKPLTKTQFEYLRNKFMHTA
jgi:hypothetical protein